MNISDMTIPNEFAYTCQMTKGNVKAIAQVRQTVIRRGAYEMQAGVFNTTRAKLGSKQKVVADDLSLEAKGNLTRALYAAGWRSEQMKYGGKDIILWWPKI